MELKNLKINVINNFLNLLAIKLSEDYLKKLKNFQKNEVDELVLQFLDQSVFLAQEGIDITNQQRNEKIKKMNAKKAKKMNKALSKNSPYSNMCRSLNFIYVVVKEEEKQEELFNNLYHWYDKYEDKISDFNNIKIWNTSTKNTDSIDLYKEIKPWILANNSTYSSNTRKI